MSTVLRINPHNFHYHHLIEKLVVEQKKNFMYVCVCGGGVSISIYISVLFIFTYRVTNSDMI